MTPQIQTQENYTATVECFNCKKTYTFEIPKGTLINDEKCHVCGCQTLRMPVQK